MFSREFHLQKYVYIFNVSNDKKFLYSSYSKNENEIVIEATLYYDFLKTYPIISLYEKREERTGFDLDNYVKEYMYYYGINNVRGGSYSNEILDKEVEEVLHQELKTVDNFDQKPKEYLLYLIIEQYRNRFQNKNEIYAEIEQVIQNRTQYRNEKKRLELLKPLIPSIYVFEDRIKKIMKEFMADCHTESLCCLYKLPFNGGSTSDLERLRCITKIQKSINKGLCKQIKEIYRIMRECLPEKIEKTEYADVAVYYKHPEFLFDNFIYSRDAGSLEKVCKHLIYFSNCIINRITEYEFDLSSYCGEDEWYFSRRIYYLEYLLNNSGSICRSN